MTLDPDLAAKLAALDAEFKDAPTPGLDDMPEPGDYQALLKSIDTFEGKKDSTQYLKLVYEIVHDPSYAGREVDFIYLWVPDPSIPDEEVRRRLGFLKADLQTLGVDTDADDFSYASVYPGSDFWDGLLDTPVAIAVRDSKKTNPETGRAYRNAYLNERLGGPLTSDIPNTIPPVEPVAAQPENGQDPIPF